VHHAAQTLRDIELFVFSAVAVATMVRWRRRREPASAWLVATFGLLVILSAAGYLLPEASEQDPGWKHLAIKVLICLLLLFPYCLYRFMTTFEPPPRWQQLVVHALVAASIVATVAMPHFPAEGTRRSTGFTLYVALFVGEWLSLSVIVVVRLWRASRALPTIPRRRAQLLAAGAAVMATDLVLSSATPASAPASGTTIVTELVAIVSATLFLLGFAPPGFLIRGWRRTEDEGFRQALVGIIQAGTPAQVVDRMLPRIAAIVGARGLQWIAEDGEVIGQTGNTTGEADLIRVSLTGGDLTIWTSPYTPFFDQEALELARTLASLLHLSLDRTIAYDGAERATRQLIEAQKIAQLGSWSLSLSTGALSWSAQMFDIHGLGAANVEPTYDSYLAAVHEEDRELAASRVQQALVDHTGMDSKYRIVRPNGDVRWLNSIARISFDDLGNPTAMFGTCQDITERREMELQLSHQALHDDLTGLPNRALFVERLDAAVSNAHALGSAVAVLFIDLDRFKIINDSLGHETGDEVLLALAERLTSVKRPHDLVARFGGDEFVVMCPRIHDGDEALDVAARAQESIRRPISLRGSDLVVTVSVGVALSTVSGADSTSLLRDADAAMYRAKRDGRDRATLFADAMRAESVARLETESELRRALAGDQLRLFYQPIVNLQTGALTALEALIRWQHPRRGLLSPEEFIPIAEDTGLIVPIGEWALEHACRQLRRWQQDYPHQANLRVAVNLSALQLTQSDITEQVGKILLRTGVSPASIELEITESVLMLDANESTTMLRSLRQLGVRVCVDDFGTGYSSLSYLKRFPVDTLKIDQSFIGGLGYDTHDSAIVHAILALAETLGLSTIAEGIETAEQLRVLRKLGCPEGQGHYFSESLPAAELAPLLASASTAVQVS
jgi:diguanylate cyclase (GGDEF)-like protein/PAS domain S-box-containing protein